MCVVGVERERTTFMKGIELCNAARWLATGPGIASESSRQEGAQATFAHRDVSIAQEVASNVNDPSPADDASGKSSWSRLRRPEFVLTSTDPPPRLASPRFHRHSASLFVEFKPTSARIPNRTIPFFGGALRLPVSV